MHIRECIKREIVLSIGQTIAAGARHQYEIRETENILTPALLIYRDLAAANIETTLRLVGGDANRWRPHVKTAKLAYVMKMLTSRGVKTFKCATSLELLTAIHAGATDMLVAYPVTGANAARIRKIAHEFPQTAISILVDDSAQVAKWRGSGIGIFIDVNSGMNRTGVEQDRATDVTELAKAIREVGLQFRGLHYYDGHLGSEPLPERTRRAHVGYDRLLHLVDTLQASGIPVNEVITAGTPSFPCTLSYSTFLQATFLHRASPGTVIYCDAIAMAQLPEAFGYVPAALVLSRVVSRPTNGVITCDAGHKTLSVDCGVPNCVVNGMEYLEPMRPSEEHLPLRVPAGMPCPEIGDLLYLIPKHVCPTVNNFDYALLIAEGGVLSTERVDARGREGPWLQP
jgi:D-serine deaminase-like pyridoxal phosphate-dependent protein